MIIKVIMAEAPIPKDLNSELTLDRDYISAPHADLYDWWKNRFNEEPPLGYTTRHYTKFYNQLDFLCQGQCESECKTCMDENLTNGGFIIKTDQNRLLDDFISHLKSMGRLQEPNARCTCAKFTPCNCNCLAIMTKYRDMYHEFRRINIRKYSYEHVFIHRQTGEHVRQIRSL